MARVVIIGSGVAGLTAGAYMAKSGHKVKIFEQFDNIGGVTATLHKDGYSWDLGPMLLQGFGPGELGGDILEDLSISDKVTLVRDDRGIVMPDFELWKPHEYGGPHWRRDYLKDVFPDEAEGLDRYYEFYDRMMDLMALNYRASRESGPKKLFLKLWMLWIFRKVKQMQGWSAEDVMNHFFRGPELKGLYTGILADFVVRPSQFMGLAVPAVNIETAFDKRIPLKYTAAGKRPSYQYIIGGCEKLVKVLSEVVVENGGEIFTNSLVTKILTDGAEVSGIRLKDGHVESADLVIASGGARETYFGLLGKEHLPQDFIDRVDDTPLMESVHMVHLGIDFNTLPYQRSALCYYYGTYDVEGAVDRCKNREYHEGRDGFLIYVPSLHSPEMAPKGHHAVTVYTIAPNNLSSGTWEDRKEELTDKLLIEAEKIIPNLRKRAKTMVIMTPEDFKKRVRVDYHGFGGRSPVMGKKGGPHKSPITGLWFVGSQSEKEGGGVCGTMAASRKVVGMIKDEGLI
ncbi:MAG: NAD(P)/FAD-dependent oxidoreductase [Deltaproteobacteria bacterium]|uniref:NAD(P)/FAD-dependent oxidoreductase n=1 Tax=Candidatus Zymogenus saltonus TaxID=2844893 RepID=A0A9D8KC20_9DELT|nr:NAD(P)/FAD-dependent oxidoreductase [Candidatus Zymogenus saltonus]